MDEQPEGLLEIGYLRRAHGVRGQINVQLASDRPERLVKGARWFARGTWLTVVEASPHQDRWLVTFEEVRDRVGAQRFTNAPAYAEPLDDPEEMWVHELIGATVVEVDGTRRGARASPSSTTRPPTCSSSTPAPSCRSCSSPSTRPGVCVIDPPDGLFELLD